jgi:hypothetical protein
MIDSHAFVDLNESSNECQAAPERVRSYPSFRVRQTNDLTRPGTLNSAFVSLIGNSF